MMIWGDYHLHSHFSDGRLSIPELVDLYGKRGFRAIAITDHVCEQRTFLGKAAHFLEKSLSEENFDEYLDTIRAEGERAREQYGMLVIPGVEITKNSFSHYHSAHILAIGISRWIDPDKNIFYISREIMSQGALCVAAHPVSTRKLESQTLHLWQHRRDYAELFDAWEVASGPYFFDEVMESSLPTLANSDLHHPRQMSSWKTGLECELHQAAVIETIRKQKDLKFKFYKDVI